MGFLDKQVDFNKWLKLPASQSVRCPPECVLSAQLLDGRQEGTVCRGQQTEQVHPAQIHITLLHAATVTARQELHLGIEQQVLQDAGMDTSLKYGTPNRILNADLLISETDFLKSISDIRKSVSDIRNCANFWACCSSFFTPLLTYRSQ